MRADKKQREKTQSQDDKAEYRIILKTLFFSNTQCQIFKWQRNQLEKYPFKKRKCVWIPLFSPFTASQNILNCKGPNKDHQVQLLLLPISSEGQVSPKVVNLCGTRRMSLCELACCIPTLPGMVGSFSLQIAYCVNKLQQTPTTFRRKREHESHTKVIKYSPDRLSQVFP